MKTLGYLINNYKKIRSKFKLKLNYHTNIIQHNNLCPNSIYGKDIEAFCTQSACPTYCMYYSICHIYNLKFRFVNPSNLSNSVCTMATVGVLTQCCISITGFFGSVLHAVLFGCHIILYGKIKEKKT